MNAPIVSLEQLRDFAAAHPDTEYNLDSGTQCLAAQTAGRPMYDWSNFTKHGFFRDEDAQVPVEFAILTETAYRLGAKTVRGTRLKNAIDALIAGEDPRSATRHIVA